jgi:hypothetical protein
VKLEYGDRARKCDDCFVCELRSQQQTTGGSGCFRPRVQTLSNEGLEKICSPCTVIEPNLFFLPVRIGHGTPSRSDVNYEYAVVAGWVLIGLTTVRQLQ